MSSRGHAFSVLPSSGSSTSFVFNVRFTTDRSFSACFFPLFFFFFSRFFLEIIDVYITSGKSPVASTVVHNFYPTGKIIKFKVLTVRLLREISQNEDQFNFSKGKKELRIIELRIESVTSGNN